MILWAACGVVLTVLLYGCTQRLMDYTALTSKNIDVSGIKQGERYSGEDCVYNAGLPFLYVTFGWPSWKTAIDEALEKGKGDVMVDAVLTVKRWNFIAGQDCLIVTGTVSQTASYKRD